MGGESIIGHMMIGELAARTGLSVRTLRFYADSGVLPDDGRTAAGYRMFGPEAVARARLIRTLRDLGIGLDDITRVLDRGASLTEVAAEHARALDTQIRVLRLQRAVLHAYIHSNDPRELQHMTDLTADERRRIVDDYLTAVFDGDGDHAVAEQMRAGAPELPDDPTPEQIAAWVEVAQLLRDPDFIASSRRMAQRALAEGPAPDPGQFDVSKAIGELAGPASRAGVDPGSPEALRIIEQLESMAPPPPESRAAAADRIEAFTDRRVGRYWTLVGIINGWAPEQAADDVVDSWEWYGRALRAHASR